MDHTDPESEASGVSEDEDKPNLGLATTRELIEEITARIDVDYSCGGGGLDYTTVGGRPERTHLDGTD